MSNKYDKLYVALVTPFKPGTEDIDYDAWRKLLQYWGQNQFVQAGGGILVNPEAGECFYTTIEEKVRLTEIALEELGDKMFVFSGVMQPTTREIVKEAKALKDVGVHGLFTPPPMGAMDISSSWDPILYPEVWTDQLKAITNVADLPIITHPTGGKYYGIPVQAIPVILDEVPNIIGWKMLTSDIKATGRVLREYKKRHVGIFMAGAYKFQEAFAYGYFDGTVSGFWNYSMEIMLPYLEAWRTNDVVKAREILFSGFMDLHEYVLGTGGEMRLHTAYKAATWLRGLIPDPFMRAPQRKLRPEEVRNLRDRLKAVGLDVISDKDIRKAYPTF